MFLIREIDQRRHFFTVEIYHMRTVSDGKQKAVKVIISTLRIHQNINFFTLRTRQNILFLTKKIGK